MSQWSRSHPDQMEEISRLPLREQNEALRAAISPLIERTTVWDGVRPECVGCGHGEHAAYACSAAALFIKGRCGCDSHYGDLPLRWRGA